MLKNRKKTFLIIFTLLTLLAVWWFSLPGRLFGVSYSTLIEAHDGTLLGATIADDGQWRFPPGDSLPTKFREAIVCFEDRRFYRHPGVDVLAIARAMQQNISERRIISGGSTITMQVVRLSQRENRTLWQKLKETWIATRLEVRYNKEEILKLYAAHAPFGGNVVGLEAAAWRYFGRSPHHLSWAEAASLAVLPNSPSLVFPGKNESIFKHKRDRLLHDLYQQGTFDSLTYSLAIKEPLPGTPRPLPSLAPHLLTRALQEGRKGTRVTTSLDPALQYHASSILNRYHQQYKRANIYNGAVVVLDVNSGKTLAYVGNTPVKGNEYGGHVDIITSPRSTGSLLKPILFGAMLDEGLLLPGTLVADIPTVIRGFTPQNFNKEYSGAVPADEAIARSLNIPAVRMLREYGVEKLHSRLQEAGLSTLRHGPDHYGLALILGGAEGTLWDMSGMYASMARSLNSYFTLPEPNRYRPADFRPPTYLLQEGREQNKVAQNGLFSAGSIWLTFQAMKEVERPESEAGWEYYSGSRPLAWKTGTSYGHRDAWAIGVNSRYVVGVWIGNADGEGRPGLTGGTMAAPVMFDVADLLPASNDFTQPQSDLFEASVCRNSGHRSSRYCETTDTILITRRGLNTLPCPYHKQIFTTENDRYQAFADCYTAGNVVPKNWFVLPAAQEWYYKRRHTEYRSLPPMAPGCISLVENSNMELIYPKMDASLIIPVELDGSKGATVFEVAHRMNQSTVYWHLDGEYAGKTEEIHQMSLSPGLGKHQLLLTDEKGDRLEVAFEVQ
ncbi:penicillin-binding protein 1C [Roseivirga sp. BDSF3-8]|uniref:penicillin-binding protein 1C n=1 Tax=Roseivirga sp. BDSF3-8 TaxID=3241598 RepID=UPI003531E6B5